MKSYEISAALDPAARRERRLSGSRLVQLTRCPRTLFDIARGSVSETIVVDNASSDGSAAVVRERFPEVSVIAFDVNRDMAPQQTRDCRGRPRTTFCSSTRISARSPAPSLSSWLAPPQLRKRRLSAAARRDRRQFAHLRGSLPDDPLAWPACGQLDKSGAPWRNAASPAARRLPRRRRALAAS